MIPPDQPTYNVQPVTGPYGITYFVAAPTEDDSAAGSAPGPEAEPDCACDSLGLTGSGHDAACAWILWKRRTKR